MRNLPNSAHDHAYRECTRYTAAMRSPDAKPKRIAAIVCAAGVGTRFGGGPGSKLDADLCGKPVLVRAVEALAQRPEIALTIVAGPAHPDALGVFCDRYGRIFEALGAHIHPGGVHERSETVRAGLHALEGYGIDIDAVLVHDGARPCTPSQVISSVILALSEHRAVVPAVPVADTLKRAETSNQPGVVQETIDRRGLFACQTPQGFDLALLRRAHSQEDLSSTDDAQLVERLGETVVLVPGDARNVKITRPDDLLLARAIWPSLAGVARPAQ